MTPPYSILYDDTQVNKIYITMDIDSLSEMYDELENEHEYAVQFVFDRGTQTDTLQDVGFRLRGNTSLTSAKKSFKVSFNTYNPGRTFETAKKLNLIGNHNDPTMVREKTYFDIYNRLGLPMRRVGFAEVYINDQYFGFYTVVEEYDDIWCRDRYGDDAGALFKCLYGSTFTYNGENTGAYNTYEQQSNEQVNMKGELAHMFDVLNNTPIADLPCAFEPLFDVDQFLKIYALDISTGHWDNYGANQNNYYLYHDLKSGQYKFLSYDCDNVLGIDWFGIDWGTRNVYDWNFDGRPLVERLLQVDVYRERFSYYLNLIATYGMDTDYWYPRLDDIRDLIAPSALADIYRTMDYGYSYGDFLDGFDTDDIDGHCPYGIKNFFDTRINSTLDQVELSDIAPIIHFPQQDHMLLEHGDYLNITVFIEEDVSVSAVQLLYSNNETGYSTADLYDDGAHGDGIAGDNIYGNTVIVPMDGTTFYYHIIASDNTGNESVYPVCENIARTIGYTTPTLHINEVMPDNVSTVPDGAGEFPDFIELYNYGLYAIDISNLFITDELDRPTKWRLPDMMLPFDSYVLIFADNETEQGLNHATFSIDADKDDLFIYGDVTTDYYLIDSTSFKNIPPDVSWGRLPNGTGPFTNLPVASPGAYNTVDTASLPDLFEVILTNNPGTHTSEVIITNDIAQTITLHIFNMAGQEVFKEAPATLPAGTYSYSIPADRLGSGAYLIRIGHGDKVTMITYSVL